MTIFEFIFFLFFCTLILILFCFKLYRKINKKLNKFDDEYIMDFYKHCMCEGEIKNRIDWIEKALKMKFPNIEKEMMERYSKNEMGSVK